MAQKKRSKNKQTAKQAPIGHPQIEVSQPSPSNLSLPSPGSVYETPTGSGNDVRRTKPSSPSPPPNASFFQTPDNVLISGGQFNNSLGPHVTINLNQGGPEISTGERSGKANLTSVPTTPTRQSIPPASSVGSPISSEATSSTGISVPFESSSRSQLEVFPQKSNEMYERHLWLKGRGFPFWIPEPNKRLPLAYRKKGINIGDVGIITPSGAFSFLFNICVPSDDPINPHLLPEGFAPIYPPLDALDVAEFDEFKPGSYLASASIENSQSESDGRGLVFVSSASEGAILTMPEGAVAFDLENIPAFRDYVAANVEKWYKYVNGVRGREAKNGDVRLVIGCDKTTSWGMAALANVTQHKVSQLKFKATEDSNVKSTRPTYTWDYSGMAEVRAGPDIKEVNALRSNDDPFDATPPREGDFCNQCLFIRTLNATLNDEAWKELHKNIGSTNVLDSSPSSRTIFPETPPRSQRSTFNTSFNTPQSSPDRTNFGNQRSPTRPIQSFRLDEEDIQHYGNAAPFRFDHLGVPTLPSRIPHPGTENDTHENRVAISTTPDAITYHPSNGLNKLLLKKFPKCKMVVTEDRNWYTMVKEGDNDLPGPEQLLERILFTHDICMKNGVLFLERKPKLPTIPGDLIEKVADPSEDEIKASPKWLEPLPSATTEEVASHPQGPRKTCSNCRKMGFKCRPAAADGKTRCQQCIERGIMSCENSQPLGIPRGVATTNSPKRFSRHSKSETTPGSLGTSVSRARVHIAEVPEASGSGTASKDDNIRD